MRVKVLLGIILLVSVFFTGCMRTEPGQGVTVSFYGKMNSTESGFVLDGEVVVGGGYSNQDTFQNVSVILYSDNGTPILEEELGDLDAEHGSLNVSLSSSAIPKYVIIFSPDFWRSDSVQVKYYKKEKSGEYGVYYITQKNQLPVTPSG